MLRECFEVAIGLVDGLFNNPDGGADLGLTKGRGRVECVSNFPDDMRADDLLFWSCID